MKTLIAVLTCLGLALPMTACARSVTSGAAVPPPVPSALVAQVDAAQPILPALAPHPVTAKPRLAPMTPAAWAPAPAMISRCGPASIHHRTSSACAG